MRNEFTAIREFFNLVGRCAFALFIIAFFFTNDVVFFHWAVLSGISVLTNSSQE